MSAGHIRRRGERSWELKFEVPDAAPGRRRTRYVSFKGTKREAEKELARLVAEASSGSGVEPSRLTVSAFLSRWLRDWVADQVSPRTGERYAQIVRLYVEPQLGALLLQKLRPADLAALYGQLLREGGQSGRSLSARSIGHVHRVLHRALGHAVQWGLAVRNVAASVDRPRVVQEEVVILAPDQVRQVLDALDGELAEVAGFALATGMRRGELLALRWRDVDLDRALVRVERAVEQTRSGIRYKAPKTRHGRRTITLPASAVRELRARWVRVSEQRLALGLGKTPADALVFSKWDGSPAWQPNSLSHAWQKATGRIGAEGVTFHALRHTHASALIAAGVDVLTVSRRLGHGSPAITLAVYGHLFASTDDRAALAIEAALAGGRSTE